MTEILINNEHYKTPLYQRKASAKYYYNNKEKFFEYKKQYYANHKDTIYKYKCIACKTKLKSPYDCNIHKKINKHKKNIETLNEEEIDECIMQII